ncbi:LysR family transcriptional regulator [Paenalcaligenes sp. Me131]|uniref:LysR family transcriptional regulator n=1 Tax=Paenalcaligenes sp. Me131 TaxID=3392636 RepID=UPI003D2BBF11
MQFSVATLLRRLRLSQLYIFDETLSRGSILAASRVLHMSQPAVTKAIQDMEETLGQSLFIRTSQGVRPTEFGLMLERHIKTLVTDFRYLIDDLNNWNTGISGRIVVGTMLTASVDFLPRAIMRLKELAPNVTVEIKVGVNEKLHPGLAKGELDIMLGLLPLTSAQDELEHTVLYEESLCAVVGKQNPLAVQLKEDWLLDEGLSWIIPPVNTEAGAAVTQFFERRALKHPLRTIESVSIMTNIGILTESNFVALMPSTVAHRFIQLGVLSLLPLNDRVVLGSIGYTLLKDRPTSPACQRFIDALNEVVLATLP